MPSIDGSRFMKSFSLIFLILNLNVVFSSELSLTLNQAEQRTLDSSDTLKAVKADLEFSEHQREAQFQSLLPKLSLTGNFQYNNYIPQISLVRSGPSIPFGTHDTYSVGPTLTYTLWDGFSSKDSYHSANLLAEAKKEDQKNTNRQLLLSIRSSYVLVQLELEELKLIHGSLHLAQAQNRDVGLRYRAGSASKLDLVNSERSVLSYEIQFQQRQADLAIALKDLLSLLGDHETRDLSHPGPPNVPNVSYVVNLEPLAILLAKEKQNVQLHIDANHPRILSQKLQSESFDLSAKGISAKAGPTVQLAAGVQYTRPSMPNPPSFWQESVGVTVSLPLFLGDTSRAATAAARSQAEALRHRAEQTRIDIEKDFAKTQELLASLYDQQKLAYKDVKQSEEAAKLNYISYKSGKINYVDVQNANNQSLQSKVVATRIDAQILNQIALLKSLSGDSNGSKY